MLWKNHLEKTERNFTLCGAPVTHFFEDPLYSSLLGTAYLAVVPVRGKIDGLHMMVALGIMEGEGCLMEIENPDGPVTTDLLPAIMGVSDNAGEIIAAVWVDHVSVLPVPEGAGVILSSWIWEGGRSISFPSNPDRRQNSPVHSVIDPCLLHKCLADWGRMSWVDMEPRVGEVCEVTGATRRCSMQETCTVSDLNTLAQIYTHMRLNYYVNRMALQWSSEEYFPPDVVMGLVSGLVFKTIAEAGVFRVEDPVRFVYLREAPSGLLSVLLVTKQSAANSSYVFLTEMDSEDLNEERVVWGGVGVQLKSFSGTSYKENCLKIIDACKLAFDTVEGGTEVPCDMVAAGVILKVLKQEVEG